MELKITTIGHPGSSGLQMIGSQALKDALGNIAGDYNSAFVSY